MRVLITADLEGASGVVGLEQAGEAYQAARRWLTGDINAAVEGAMEAGATSFVVHDGHRQGQETILLDELHPAAEVVRGRPIILCEEADLARGYDGAFLVGMHARPGQPAVLGHCCAWPLVREVRLNGQPVGEAELVATLVGAYGIPTLLVTGDDRVCLDVQRWSSGKIEAAVVKYALSRYTARCLPLIEARERIRIAARQAVERLPQARAFVAAAPVDLEVELDEREAARRVAWMPQVAYDGERTLHYAHADYRQVYRAFLAMLAIATSPFAAP
ncbi:MAG TPA: M55 family metallopeptidase [Anaerolineae bacterium]|nr:M55 family metallopeptidase [Anaerolineae bacterium]HOQ99207.1 M55 family metallopeptidase [Anaerolineae bacterium]HPL28285.1 M55 family metallopeptidase [Anaerolineae bacterium]